MNSGIVTGVNALVAENPANLVDALEAADDKSFEVKLEGYAQLELLVKSVGVGEEGTSRSAAGVGNEHGSLNLDKVLSVEVTADSRDDLGALDKGVLYLGVHDQVDVALTVAQVGVSKSVVLLGQGLE